MRIIGAICLSLFFLALPHETSIAGDAERQLVFKCYNQGSSTLDDFERCTGLTGTINDFRGCLSSNSCFAGAPGGAIPSVQLGLQCAKQANGDITQFARCTGGDVILPEASQALIRCAEDNMDVSAFASCAAPTAGIKLSDDQRVAIGCAERARGDEDEFVDCLGNAVIGRSLNSTQRDAVQCASQSGGQFSSFADCAAEKIFSANATPEMKIAARCAAESGGDLENFGVCAGTAYMGLRLNPEQQIAVECVVSTGGQLYMTAGCIATRLTGRELEKCVTDGFGGKGCFGDTNDLFGYKGWTARTLKALAGGPNSVFNNPAQVWGGPNSMIRNPSQIWGGPNSMFRNPGQVFGGPNSVFNNPAQVWGGPNSMIRNPGQVLGGPNSVFNNPAQLLPKPATVGTIGGHRVCIPWC
jgi:hypothetical protein